MSSSRPSSLSSELKSGNRLEAGLASAASNPAKLEDGDDEVDAPGCNMEWSISEVAAEV